ncbi:MAG: hypothetical protein AAFY60_12545, partial [Myxococcota bacterium]
MASTLGASDSPQAPERILEALSSAFRRVAVFRLEGTRAILAQRKAMGGDALELSLVERTPLRSAIEAASPIVGSGRDPGGLLLSRALKISPARTFAIVPLVENRRVVALAYGDRIDEPFSLT